MTDETKAILDAAWERLKTENRCKAERVAVENQTKYEAHIAAGGRRFVTTKDHFDLLDDAVIDMKDKDYTALYTTGEICYATSPEAAERIAAALNAHEGK